MAQRGTVNSSLTFKRLRGIERSERDVHDWVAAADKAGLGRHIVKVLLGANTFRLRYREDALIDFCAAEAYLSAVICVDTM